jgi:hypothetical protein
MSRYWQIAVGVFFVVLVIIGSGIITAGLIKTGEMPQGMIPINNSYYFPQNEFSAVFYIKIETEATLMANNPINFSVTTNSLDVRQIQLEFLGASLYFPNRTQPVLPTLPSYPTEQDWQLYEKQMDTYWNEVEKQNDELRNSLEANILQLQNDTNLYVTFPFENVSYPNYPTFSGAKEITYPVGGKYSIGVTVTLSDGGVVGYGVGNTAYVLNDVVEVAPLETKYQLENNSIMVGLGWIGIGITMALAGIALLVEFRPFRKTEQEKLAPKIVLEFPLDYSNYVTDETEKGNNSTNQPEANR